MTLQPNTNKHEKRLLPQITHLHSLLPGFRLIDPRLLVSSQLAYRQKDPQLQEVDTDKLAVAQLASSGRLWLVAFNLGRRWPPQAASLIILQLNSQIKTAINS